MARRHARRGAASAAETRGGPLAVERAQLGARAEGRANDRRSRRQRRGDDGARRRGVAAALPRPSVVGPRQGRSASRLDSARPSAIIPPGFRLGSTALRQHDQQFFDSFMLVIGILMGAAVGLFFLVRAISIDTQGLYITEDPTVQEAIDERIKPVGRVLLMGDAELAAAAAAAVATPTPVATVMTGPQVYNAACIVCHQPPGHGRRAAGRRRRRLGAAHRARHGHAVHACARGLPGHEGLHAAEGRPRRSLRRRDQRQLSTISWSSRASATRPTFRRSATSLADYATIRNPVEVSRGSARGSVTVKVAPPSGLLSAAMVPLCASTIRPCDREAYAEALRFRRDEWREQPADDIRPQTRSSVAYGDFHVGGRDLAADRDVTLGRRCLGHRVHGVDHQVHEHLLQQHRIAADDARSGRQIDGCLDLPCSYVVGHEGKAFRRQSPEDRSDPLVADDCGALFDGAR